MDPVVLSEIWRGDFLESAHRGHAVVANADGTIEMSWGDPAAVVLPRSSAKMVQALPLLRSGAAKRFGLTSEHLALACASHNGAACHTDRVNRWLSALDLSETDLRCGAQPPKDEAAQDMLRGKAAQPCQIHNNCSGKHAGYLTLAKHLEAGPDYIDAEHPVQIAVRAAFEEATDAQSPGWAVDGCSAPNFATTVTGMARAMARFSAGADDSAESMLTRAMIQHPELVAGEGRACTRLMRACGGKVALKTGAEGFFVAILPEKGLGVALKIADGGTRAAECAIAGILIKLGILSADHPEAQAYANAPVTNWRGIVTGHMRATL